MMGRFTTAIAFVVAALALAFGSAPARATVTCTGVMNGAVSSSIVGYSALNAQSTINDNVTVPSGASCTLMFYIVTGNVQAQNGASLTLQYDTINGNVQVANGGSLLVNAYAEPSTIGGNVQAANCGSALIEGDVTISGNVQIQNCSGSGPNGFQGPDVSIKGDFQCQNNAGGCEAWLGTVGGNAQVQSNGAHGPTDVSLVVVGGNLQCQQNSPAPTHSHGYDWVTGNVQGQCAGFSTTGTSIAGSVTPVASCAALASLSAAGFPVPNTVITSAVDTAAGGGLPERCIVKGYVNRHLSPVDNCYYQDGFNVQLPLPASWNGRFFAQGGSGTEGSVPTATGPDSGSAGANYGILNGYAVEAQDGGHENTDLTVASCDDGYGNTKEYQLDPAALIGNSYESVQVSALTAKYIIDEYYGSSPKFSYWVGCSTGGRQAMVVSQTFPQYFDGIIAGDPVFNIQGIGLSGIWSIQQFYDLAPSTSYTYVTEAAPAPPAPIVYNNFPKSDQALFETALLQACDALDGVADGVIDNLPACNATFNPATATYVSGGVTYPLQCTGAKNATCLTAAQIQAIGNIVQGARTTSGMTIEAPAVASTPDHFDPTVQGIAYDGGYMGTTGLPLWKIGSAASPPSDYALDGTAFGFGLMPPDPGINPMTFNFTTDQDLLRKVNPIATSATSLDISKFINYGHKMIWYLGLSDTLAPVLYTTTYYNEMAAQQGGLPAAQNFSRYYPVPNMGHCSGNPATDQFDMLSPLVHWVESGTAPGPIPATGVNFTAATYQVGFVSGAPDNAPTTRSRPICAYPQEARFTGSTTVIGGVPVATNPSDLANASNYQCVSP